MAHAYILDRKGRTVALIDSYDRMEWSRDYFRFGFFKMEVNRHVSNADRIERGLLFAPVDEFFSLSPDQVFLIEQIDQKIDRTGKDSDILSVIGRDMGGLFQERLALPTTGQKFDEQTGNTETLMKHYVDVNAGPSAAVNRQIPNLVVAVDQARGVSRTFQARFQKVSKILSELGFLDSLGWEVTFDNASDEFIFEVLSGEDRSATVFFDIDFDTALMQRWLESELEQKTFAFVGGSGEGTARTIEEVFIEPSEPSGFDRRELFIDAGDLDTSAQLQARGETVLNEKQPQDKIQVDVNKFGSFKYRADWDLGDIITVRNEEWNLQKALRIVKVKQIFTNQKNTSDIQISLQREIPNIKDNIQGLIPADGTSRK